MWKKCILLNLPPKAVNDLKTKSNNVGCCFILALFCYYQNLLLHCNSTAIELFPQRTEVNWRTWGFFQSILQTSGSSPIRLRWMGSGRGSCLHMDSPWRRCHRQRPVKNSCDDSIKQTLEKLQLQVQFDFLLWINID